MESHGPTTGLVYCWTNMIDSDGFFLQHCISKASRVRPPEVGNYLTREEQDGEDWDLSMRIAERYEVHCSSGTRVQPCTFGWAHGRKSPATTGQCLLLMPRTARSDPGYLLNPSMYRLFIKSAARLVFGQRWQRHNHRSPGTTNSISGVFPPFHPAGTPPAFPGLFFQAACETAGVGLRAKAQLALPFAMRPLPFDPLLRSPR
jgi:hypothetical protein